jgi:hypothetical protein
MFIPNIDIEEAFEDFFEEYGAEVSDKVLAGANVPTNPDYIFHEEKIIAELKILKVDPFRNKDFVKSLEKKKREWVQKGYITASELSRVTRLKQLPDKPYKDAIKLYMGPVKRHIEKANDQIKKTKTRRGLDEFKGLLLLASDGNYLLEPEAIRNFVATVLRNPGMYRSINTVLYFTVNTVTTKPDDSTFVRLWVNLWRDKEHFENVPLPFLNKLYDGWVERYKTLTGLDLKKLSNMNEEGITEVDDLPKTKLVRPIRIKEEE